MNDALTININLTNKYVAFLDVMGFTKIVFSQQTERLQEYFSQVTSVLNKLREDKEDIQTFSISDSIILIAPDSFAGLRQLLIAIRTIQYKLLLKKILLRSAVSYGPVYYNKDYNIIVGKGYINAFFLEQKAVFPRVIIDPKIIPIHHEDRKAFIVAINKPNELDYHGRLIYVPSKYSLMSDDAIFIDYANRIIRDYKINQSINTVFDLTKENLYSDQSLFEKYIWFKNYFLECLEYTIFLTEDNAADKEFKDELNRYKRKFGRL